jgi:protocatechuate 3,4-dioxygenase beta subunit
MIPTPADPYHSHSGDKRDISRRRMLHAALALGSASLLGPAGRLFAADAPLTPTPRNAKGPFYPVKKPADQDADLTVVAGRNARAEGTVLYLSGRILDTRGKPQSGAVIELWQANTYGRYDHPNDDSPVPLDPNFQGYGLLRADAEGRYRIKTIKPAPYSGRTRHIHFIVAGSGMKLTTQMFFPDEKLNDDDGLWRYLDRDQRRASVARYTDGSGDMESGALAATWDVVLKT